MRFPECIYTICLLCFALCSLLLLLHSLSMFYLLFLPVLGLLECVVTHRLSEYHFLDKIVACCLRCVSFTQDFRKLSVQFQQLQYPDTWTCNKILYPSFHILKMSICVLLRENTQQYIVTSFLFFLFFF